MHCLLGSHSPWSRASPGFLALTSLLFAGALPSSVGSSRLTAVNFSTDSTRTTSEGQLHLMAMQDSMTHMRLEGENKGNECQGLVQSGMGGSLIRIQSSSKAYDGI